MCECVILVGPCFLDDTSGVPRDWRAWRSGHWLQDAADCAPLLARPLKRRLFVIVHDPSTAARTPPLRPAAFIMAPDVLFTTCKIRKSHHLFFLFGANGLTPTGLFSDAKGTSLMKYQMQIDRCLNLVLARLHHNTARGALTKRTLRPTRSWLTITPLLTRLLMMPSYIRHGFSRLLTASLSRHQSLMSTQ